jgi:hypothetical protein
LGLYLVIGKDGDLALCPALHEGAEAGLAVAWLCDLPTRGAGVGRAAGYTGLGLSGALFNGAAGKKTVRWDPLPVPPAPCPLIHHHP